MQTETLTGRRAKDFLLAYGAAGCGREAGQILRFGVIRAAAEKEKEMPSGGWLRLPLQAPLPVCDRVRPLVCDDCAVLCWPFAKKEMEKKTLHGMLQKENAVVLLLPPGFAGWPGEIFRKGYQLVKIRPAAGWKPFGIFVLSPKGKNGYNKKEVLPLAGLYPLSRRLEEGGRGIARTHNGILTADRMQEQKKDE